MGFLNGWLYRKELTIDHDSIDSNLTNFPILVKLTSSNFDFTKAKSDGSDIRFTSSDGETLLKYERENHDDTGETAEYWIKIPSVSSSLDTVFYIYYGNDSASDGEDAENVWDSYYKGIWNLPESGDGTLGEYKDSTSNNNDGQGGAGTPTNVPTRVDGKVYKAQDFDGNDYISVPDSADWDLSNNDFTLSFSVKFDSTAGNQCFLGRGTSGVSYFYFALESGSLRFRDYNGGDVVNISNAWSGVTTGVFYDVEITRNGNNFKYFIDGIQLGSTVVDSDSLFDRSVPLQIGANTTIGYYMNGVIDNVRWSVGIDRGQAWRDARIDSYNDNLLTFGEEEINKVEIIETINIDDSWNIYTNPEIAIFDETINLSDAWNIQTNPGFAEIEETITIADSWNIVAQGTASYASKIISFNPLVIITNTDPVRVVKVNITDPENPTWEVYTYNEVSEANDISYNSTFDLIYIACANGKILQVDGSDFNTYQIMDTSDLNDLTTITSLDDFHRLYAGTDDSTGEIIYVDKATIGTFGTDIRCLELKEKKLDLDIRTINAGIIGTDIRCLETINNGIGLDIRTLTDPFDEIALDVINQTDFHVKINGVEVEDVLLDSISIYHPIDDESTATFSLQRKHDAFNTPIAGGSSQINNQNSVQILIKDHVEFTGKVRTINTKSENEIVEVIARSSSIKNNERRTLKIPMSTLNTKLHPYDCLVHDPSIDNPEIDPNDENPEYYLGIEIDLGTEIKQSIARWQWIYDVSEEVLEGTFQPKQNWTYFWFGRAFNHLTGVGQFTSRYMGTSPANLTSDIWEVEAMTYFIQREFDDIETELGTYQLGTAPYKSISVKNGKKIAKDRWIDKEHGLWRQRDSAYDYVEYAKEVASLEYEKLQTIGGTILPKASCNIELMIDGYYYYNPTLLTRINVDNTTESGIFDNSNGFPVSVKAIEINSATMRVTLKCDNQLSSIELEEIDDRYPDPDSDEYTFGEEGRSVTNKYDYSRFEEVE